MTSLPLFACLALLPFGGASPGAGAAEAEGGLPFAVRFTDRDYDGHSQNWAVAQDPRGVMYFGNSAGVLEFDGVRWRTLPVVNGSIVRSLAVDRAGTVYVGAVDELGYLAPDAAGVLGYVSLLAELPGREHGLGDVWRTFATADGVYFWTLGELFLWDGERFRSWRLRADRVLFEIGGEILYNEKGVGLMSLAAGSLRPVAGGELLADLPVTALAPWGDHSLFVGARDGRLFVLSRPEGRLARLVTEIDDELATHLIYHGLRLQDDLYALATVTGGAFVIDGRGRLRHRFDKEHGLPDDSVWFLYADRERGLWLALNRGLARFEMGTPAQVFGELSGLEGTVEAVARHRGTLYAATSLGLFALEDGELRETSAGGAPFWSLLADGECLLAGASHGVYEIRGGAMKLVLPVRNAFELRRSSRSADLVWVGSAEGVDRLRRAAGSWSPAGKLAGVDEEVRSIAEDDDGNLWLGTLIDGVRKVTLDGGPDGRVLGVERLDTEQGLPSLRSVKVCRSPPQGRLLFATEAGLYELAAAGEHFVPSPLLGPSAVAAGVLRLVVDAAGNLWMSLYDGSVVVALREPDGSYRVDRDLLQRLSASSSMLSILPEPDGSVWLGGVDGLWRFAGRTSGGGPRPPPPPVLIRTVRIARPDGATLYGGGSPVPAAVPALPFSSNSLRFEYALPSFDGRDRIVYQSRLAGLGEAWGDWTGESYRDFTALREGRYRFEVQGRDAYGRLSGVAAFSFQVLPPWYRSWWAYGLYALAAVALLAGTGAWQLRRTRWRLEARRLAEANELMRRADRERQQLVGELETKNAEMERFIYTVSHDLKSPLITVRGFLGMLGRDLERGDAEQMRRDMAQIHAATDKMSRLVDELLELSRIGRVAEVAEDVSLTETARETLEQVAGPVAERGVEVEIASDLPVVIGDPSRLREMLQNLIENAVKYMGDQAKPRIEIGSRRDGGETVVFVRDNGMGVAPSYHQKIFELFERLDPRGEGTGIGLAVVQRIVEVHGGRVWVESEGAGRGSTFCFTLPAASSPPAP